MAEEKYVPRLKTKYNNEVKQQLQDKFQYDRRPLGFVGAIRIMLNGKVRMD